MGTFFHTVVFQPIYNALFAISGVIPGHDFGIALIILTVLIKCALVPLSRRQIEDQKRMQALQPKMAALSAQYKNDRQGHANALMALYRKEKINPFGFLMINIGQIGVQIMVFFAIYKVLLTVTSAAFAADPALLYGALSATHTMDPYLFGLVDLSQPNVVIAVLAGGVQYVQSKLMISTKSTAPGASSKEKGEERSAAEDFTEIMNKQMLYVFPVITVVIGLTFAAGLPLYWFVATGFAAAQQYFLLRKNVVHSAVTK